ncbi:Translation initiation factor IF-2 [Frankliniella fusca]|uniref:Translation initiation factor IF-2 n=1 Tax=Frankliniella fusca TaxID=407009 RepID=A0AAE1L7X9_9NEOP|nr:Translation initiation factor IF-2 [Frankliniella fusca]
MEATTDGVHTVPVVPVASSVVSPDGTRESSTEEVTGGAALLGMSSPVRSQVFVRSDATRPHKRDDAGSGSDLTDLDLDRLTLSDNDSLMSLTEATALVARVQSPARWSDEPCPCPAPAMLPAARPAAPAPACERSRSPERRPVHERLGQREQPVLRHQRPGPRQRRTRHRQLEAAGAARAAPAGPARPAPAGPAGVARAGATPVRAADAAGAAPPGAPRPAAKTAERAARDRASWAKFRARTQARRAQEKAERQRAQERAERQRAQQQQRSLPVPVLFLSLILFRSCPPFFSSGWASPSSHHCDG